MPVISVLMSVFNEEEAELRTSIESVINQSFGDFEFIIVNDNPSNAFLNSILMSYAKKDNRVVVLQNEANLGLASSLNRAAEIAKGKYLLRTDADDICVRTRFEKQIRTIIDKDLDLVCSDYFFIDEQGGLIDRIVSWYDSESIKLILPWHNIIHHPTIIMKASVFRLVGGYRDFPCAQDYDLWLRMVANDCSFYMIPEKLLYYRVRENSTTARNRLKQVYTIKYIQKVYNYYKKVGVDCYDHKEYLRYLSEKRVDDREIVEKFEQSYQEYHQAVKDLRNKQVIKGMKRIISVLISSDYYRSRIVEELRFLCMSNFGG
ncbi:MAG: glycosyltransferase [Clostridiales bacterium]|nr:glycosyltransferase [Clostridiales bacterium]